jgi:hypothetical protein
MQTASTPTIDPARLEADDRHDGAGMRIARNADLILLAVALPLFLVTGLPLLGWATATAAWVLQRLLRDFLAKRARNAEDPRSIVGYMTGSLIGRGWLCSLIIFGVGFATEDEVGLSAALLFIATFTLYLTITMIVRPFESGEPI